MDRNSAVVVKRPWRIAWLLVVSGILAYGLTREFHLITSLNDGEVTRFDGAAYLAGTTFDQFAMHEDMLLAPLSGTGTNMKDCKT